MKFIPYLCVLFVSSVTSSQASENYITNGTGRTLHVFDSQGNGVTTLKNGGVYRPTKSELPVSVALCAELAGCGVTHKFTKEGCYLIDLNGPVFYITNTTC